MANLITLLRIGLLLVGVGFIYSLTVVGQVIAFFLILVVILLDWLDGVVARRRGQADDVGAVMDILGDRIVENVLWIVFADIGLLPVWVPLIVIMRGLVTDAIRSIALTHGQTAFGERTLMRSTLGRWLVVSRMSRALYAAAKLVTFGYLILLLAGRLAHDQGWVFGPLLDNAGPMLYRIGMGLAYFTVAFCLVRGIPVMLDGWHYLYRREPSGDA